MGKYIFAETAEQLEEARKLILEYAESLGCSPCLANIDQEMKNFPGPFAPPSGRLILAKENNEAAGVIGVKKVDDSTCEMARLFVRPKFQGKGFGKGLAAKSLLAARELGYNAARLYTLPSMATALAMYRRMGFLEISPYTDHPIEGAVYMEFKFSDNNKS